MSTTDTKAVHAFHESASAYCALIESIAKERPSDLYSTLEACLSQLAFDATRLPTGTPDLKDDDTHGLNDDDRREAALSQKVHGVLHGDCVDLMAMHENDKESADRVWMLWDDLVGIYADLKDGMSLFCVGTERAVGEAIWQWRFGFETHWGEHLYSALLPVHEMRYVLYRR